MTSTEPSVLLTGGCLCGRLRYRAEGPIIDAGYCHCRSCQRIGGPVVAWVEMPIAGFSYTSGSAKAYQSSDWAERRFCPDCGAYLDFRLINAPTTVSLNTSTLDDPALAPPRRHIFCDSRIGWFDTADALPRYNSFSDG